MKAVYVFVVGICMAFLFACSPEENQIIVSEQIIKKLPNYSTTGEVASYSIKDDELSLIRKFRLSDAFNHFEDSSMHYKLWEFYSKLIPSTSRSDLVRIKFFAGYFNSDPAEIVRIDSTNVNRSYWEININLNQSYINTELNKPFLGYFLIHELSDLLTLNSDQVSPDSISLCDTYVSPAGCSSSNSYLAHFFSDYWSNIYDEYKTAENHGTDSLLSFYTRHQDQFINKEAAKSPEDDVAESFTHFVLYAEQPPEQRIADKKINFFYLYPELNALRGHIRQNIDFEVSIIRGN